MKRVIVEKMKTVLLGGLILTSIVLLGIHWRQQSEWFPFRFVTAWFAQSQTETAVDVDYVRWDCIRPSHIYVYEAAKAQWMLPSSMPSYARIWNDIRTNYLPVIIDSKPAAVTNSGRWDNLITSGDTIIEFHTEIPFELIAWMANKELPDSDSGMHVVKMAIQPSEDVNASVQTILLLTDKGVYKYLVDVKEESLPKSVYSSLLKTAKSTRQSISMSMLGAFGSIAAEPDILVNFLSRANVSYPTLEASVPEGVRLRGTDIEMIQENVLLDLKDSLIARLDMQTGDAVFSDVDHEYRLTREGLLTYKRTIRPGRNPGDLAAAFEQALSFIESRKLLWPDMEVVLTRVEERDDRYVFSFAFAVGDLLVRMSPDAASPEKPLEEPIVIAANEDGVLDCVWHMMQLTIGEPVSYSIFFVDLLNDILPEAHPEALPNREAGRNLEKLDYGYVLDSNDFMTVAPSNPDESNKPDQFDVHPDPAALPEEIIEAGITLKPNWLVTIAGKLYVLPLNEE